MPFFWKIRSSLAQICLTLVQYFVLIIKQNENKIYFLLKEFKFKNFKDSQNFINKVGDIAETEGHHPDIWFGWGYAKIKIFTHAIKGLHESDFVLAAKIDKLINV